MNYIKSSYAMLDSFEKRIVDEYVKYCIDLQRAKRERIINATALAIPNEFIVRSKSAILKPTLLSAIHERLTKASSEQDLSPDRLLKEYGAIAFSKLTDFLTVSDYGTSLKDLNDIPEQALGAIKTIETKQTGAGEQVKIVMHDKQPALRALAELMGLIAPDRPPTLMEYVRPIEIKGEATVVNTEDEYNKLLEDMR